MSDDDDLDWDRIDEAALALLSLTLHPHERGLISSARSKARSVVISDEGLALAEEILRRDFTKGG